MILGWIRSSPNVGRGAFSHCQCRTPISGLIYYLCCSSTHMPRNTHLTIFELFAPTQTFQSCWRAWVLSVGAVSVSPLLLTPPSATVTPVPLSVAGQQGSWGCRLLFRTAEAAMGEEVSSGIGRLGLSDFSSHILLRPNHHQLRVKYVCPCFRLFRKDSRGSIFTPDSY